jgi:hypothetical protein
MSRAPQGFKQTGVQIGHHKDKRNNNGPDQLFSFLELTPTPSPSIDGVEYWDREKYGLVKHTYPDVEGRFSIKSSPQLTPNSSFPEGGWRAWSTVLGGCVNLSVISGGHADFFCIAL